MPQTTSDPGITTAPLAVPVIPARSTRPARRTHDDAAVAVGGRTRAALWSGEAIAARLRTLIAQREGGDVCLAARRLGVGVAGLVRLEETMVADKRRAALRVEADAILLAAILHYGVSAAWLLTGCDEPDLPALPKAVRDRLVYLVVGAAHAVADRYAPRNAPGS